MQDLAIWVTEVPAHDEHTKAIFSPSADAVLKRLPLDKLRENLGTACKGVAAVLQGIRDDLQHVGGFKLQQVAVQVEINAEGGVELVGTAKVGGKGAITLTFGE